MFYKFISDLRTTFYNSYIQFKYWDGVTPDISEAFAIEVCRAQLLPGLTKIKTQRQNSGALSELCESVRIDLPEWRHHTCDPAFSRQNRADCHLTMVLQKQLQEIDAPLRLATHN